MPQQLYLDKAAIVVAVKLTTAAMVKEARKKLTGLRVHYAGRIGDYLTVDDDGYRIIGADTFEARYRLPQDILSPEQVQFLQELVAPVSARRAAPAPAPTTAQAPAAAPAPIVDMDAPCPECGHLTFEHAGGCCQVEKCPCDWSTQEIAAVLADMRAMGR